MAFLQANLQLLEQRNPSLYLALLGLPPGAAPTWVETSSDRTLLVSGLQLTSAHDRRSEALLQAESLIPGNSSVATVYGVGLGDLPRELLRRPELKTLRVVVLNPSLLRTCFQALDHSDWLSDPRIEIVAGDDEHEVHTPFAVSPTELRLAAPETQALRNSLVAELCKPHQQSHSSRQAPALDARVAENLARAKTDGDVSALFEAAGARTAVVVAGGPTASEQFANLLANRQEFFVVAVSTALLPLQHAGIAPDVVVAIDPQPGIEDHFRGLDPELLKDVPLVYLPLVHPRALRKWPGPRLVTYIETERFKALAQRLPKTFLFCDGTVTHVAVDLAVRSGASSLWLLGVDFCFPGLRTHVDGAAGAMDLSPEEVKHRPTVLNGFGQAVPSQPNLIGYLRALELYLSRHPEVTFINTGRGGAAIAGASWREGT